MLKIRKTDALSGPCAKARAEAERACRALPRALTSTAPGRAVVEPRRPDGVRFEVGPARRLDALGETPRITSRGPIEIGARAKEEPDEKSDRGRKGANTPSSTSGSKQKAQGVR